MPIITNLSDLVDILIHGSGIVILILNTIPSRLVDRSLLPDALGVVEQVVLFLLFEFLVTDEIGVQVVGFLVLV
jgi:hypothetical protein